MFPTIVNNPLTNLSINTPPELTTATITQYYSQIDTTWELGIQQATLEGEPFSRTYSVLSFPYSETRLTKVDLTTYDPEYEGTFYYLVSNYFLESSYNSNIYKTTNNPFSQWGMINSKFRQEITYLHKQTNQLVWQRPSTGGGNTGLPLTYLPLDANYKITINVGKALGSIIIIDSPIEIRLKDNINDTGILQTTSPILLTKPILEITFKSITDTSHTLLTVNFYGEYKFRNFLPISSEDEVTLLHPIQTDIVTKRKPPGLPNLKDNFWNSNLNNISIVDFSNRGGSPQWI